jgi:hypothetical protein
MTAHRYWRLNLGPPVEAGYPMLIAEIGLCAVTGGPSVATGGTASASTTYSGSSAANLFDGNLGTQWAPADANYPVWVQYDFGSGNPQSIVDVFISTNGASNGLNAPKSFDLEYSDDGTTWTILYSSPINPTYTWADNSTEYFPMAQAYVDTQTLATSTSPNMLALVAVTAQDAYGSLGGVTLDSNWNEDGSSTNLDGFREIVAGHQTILANGTQTSMTATFAENFLHNISFVEILIKG